MRRWFFIGLAGLAIIASACSKSPVRVYKDGYTFSLGSGSKVKYEMLCASGDLKKILEATQWSMEIKDNFYKYNCSAERSGDAVNQMYASMTVEQKKDLKSAFKNYGYKIFMCPT
jgi:hypothetical protein